MSDTPHVHLPKDSNSKRLLTAFLVTAVFMVAEVVGGLLSGSLALLADAGHMLTDAAALLVALMAVHFSQRKPNARHTFGYLRLTTTAAFLNAAALLVIVVFILWEAIRRFFAPQPVMGTPMLIIAVAGLLANLFAFWLLHRGSEEKISTCAPPHCMCWATCSVQWAPSSPPSSFLPPAGPRLTRSCRCWSPVWCCAAPGGC